MRLFGQRHHAPETTARHPLLQILRKHLPFVPLIAGLGFIATALEGIGIGLLIPLLALFLSDVAPDVPEPLHSMTGIIRTLDVQSRILVLGGAVVGLIGLKALVQTANGWVLALVDTRIGNDIRNALARRLLALDYPFYLSNDNARLTRIVSVDSAEVVQAVRSGLALIPAFVGLGVIGLLLAWLHIRLFVMAFGIGMVIQSILLIFEERQRELSLEVTKTGTILWERMLLLVRAARVIRIFGQQTGEEMRFAADSDGFRQSVRAARTRQSYVGPTVDALLALLFVAILLAGYTAGMTIPVIMAFLLLLSRAQPHAYTISHSRLSIASFRGALSEVEWLLLQKPPSKRWPTLSTDLLLDRPITFDRVSFAYPDGSEALCEADFVLRPGVVTALIGKSGSGKTTIVNLLCRLVEPSSGRMRLGDLPVEAIDPAEWRSRIAAAGQDVELVDGTVADNIAYGRPDASLEEIEKVARAAGATDFIAALPHGYDTPVVQEGLNFSGGQRQRIGVARALLRNPDLLILDEATNAVDALSEMEIMKLLAERRYFRTAIVISHRKSTLAACDQGIVIEGGRVTEAGPLIGLSYFRTMAGDADAVA